MRITITTQPEPLVTLDEAKVALGESGSDRDELITSLILAAQAELDGPKSWVGIAVAEQSVEVRFDRFCDSMQLPGITIQSPLTAVTYLDVDGDEQDLDTAIFSLTSDGRIVRLPGRTWPPTWLTEEAVTVAYDVGIAPPSGDPLPAADPRISLMKTAIIMHVKMTLDMDDVEMRRRAIEALVAPLRALSV